MARRHTPFPAIVGQPELKRALLAVAADDALDGVLVRGERGTAKSTAVRALAELLPDQRAVADCPYGCPPDDPERQCDSCRERTDPPIETRSVPLVTLPLGATRERVVGTLSVADALDGDAEFDPGLLARANRGILYVDEVNLLDDHLVDVLLDAAASGVNRVERDGVSVDHPAEFTLIGTMNPEEGELRPQLRDRFALQTTVTASDDLDDRVAIIEQALGADDAGESESLPDRYRGETDALRERLLRARELVCEVDLPAEFKADIAELCRDAGVDGHRADVATARTARTLAALDGRSKVIESDVEEAASLALPHRLQRQPFDDAPDVDDVLDEQFGEDEGDDQGDRDTGSGTDDDAGGDGNDGDGGDTPSDEASGDGGGGRPADDPDPEGEDSPDNGGEAAPDPGDDPAPGEGADDPDAADRPTGASADATPDDGESGGDEGTDPDGTATPLVPGERRAEVGDAAAPPVDGVETEAADADGGSRVGVAPSAEGQGSRVRTERATPDGDIDAAASVRAAAADGRDRVTDEDLRTSVRADTAGALVVFVVDASASMRPAMREAKGTVLSLLEGAYQQRDEVAFVAVAGDDAEVLLPPTDSVALAARHLKELPAGDRTPLPAGLDAAGRLLTGEDVDAGVVVVVTDGRANVAGEGKSPTEATRAAARRLAAADPLVVLVDAGDDGAGVTGIVERETDAARIPLSELSAERVADAVGDR
ncbi:VWA domain-containing protein [Halobellus ruber]|uniref:VWA domain-containing protein n=1 Tax=Halobellus ruber TaxID=2761102 RepID=A0A7J9SMP9_9EURY|nr:VWA domain-containing protein [Halobellus ruber]MBB6647419.1 VWA domain-containing protein [Halobellus ruber]